MSTFKKKGYEGEEIAIDEEDKNVKTITFFSNGVTVMINAEIWDAVKKELIQALSG